MTITAKDSMVTVEIYNQNAVFGVQNSTVDPQNSTVDPQNSTVESYKVNLMKKMDEIGLYSERKENILSMIDMYSFDQLFSRSLISEDLHISDDKAAELLRVLKKLDIIEPIKGQGKGKYKFKI